jgi:hypothetical protein
LAQQIQYRSKEVRLKYEETQKNNVNRSTPNNESTTGWDRGAQQSKYDRAADPLEAQFQSWEMEAELEQMKKDL